MKKMSIMGSEAPFIKKTHRRILKKNVAPIEFKSGQKFNFLAVNEIVAKNFPGYF